MQIHRPFFNCNNNLVNRRRSYDMNGLLHPKNNQQWDYSPTLQLNMFIKGVLSLCLQRISPNTFS